MTGALEADLCRLLAKSFASPFWRLRSRLLTPWAGDASLDDYVLEEGMKAYTIDKLPSHLQIFLKYCDRSVDVEWELFQGKPTGMKQEDQDEKVYQRMVEDGSIKFSDDTDDEDEDEE